MPRLNPLKTIPWPNTKLTNAQQTAVFLAISCLILSAGAIYSGLFHEPSPLLAVIKLAIGTALLVLPAYLTIRFRERILRLLAKDSPPGQRQDQPAQGPSEELPP